MLWFSYGSFIYNINVVYINKCKMKVNFPMLWSSIVQCNTCTIIGQFVTNSAPAAERHGNHRRGLGQASSAGHGWRSTGSTRHAIWRWTILIYYLSSENCLFKKFVYACSGLHGCLFSISLQWIVLKNYVLMSVIY